MKIKKTENDLYNVNNLCLYEDSVWIQAFSLMSIIVQFPLKTCIKLFLTGSRRWLSCYAVNIGVIREHEIIIHKDILLNWLIM